MFTEAKAGQGICPGFCFMKIIQSNVCRVTDPKLTAFLEEKYTGGDPLNIPSDVLPPRQVVIDADVKFTVRLKAHRGQFITTIETAEAARLVGAGKAAYEEQSALLYSIEAYLSDKDVQADEAELARAKASDADYVLVAIIGGSRSALAVCRNVVSGCQNPDRLEKDAKGALEASNVVLIED